MANIEFSAVGRAFIKNRRLVAHVLRRLRSLTPEEKETGKIDVHFKSGNVLSFRFGPDRTLTTVSAISEQKQKLTY
jgi:hypothetical protein